jgi:hypothetical protein
MRSVVATGAIELVFGLCVGIAQVGGHTIPKSLQEGGPEDIIKRVSPIQFMLWREQQHKQ